LLVPDFSRSEQDHKIGTLSISLLNDDTGTEIAINSLVDPISITLPRDENAPKPDGTFQEPYIPVRPGEYFAFSYFDVPKNEALQVKMIPEDPNVQILIVFKCDNFPNITTGENDEVCMVPHKMALAGD